MLESSPPAPAKKAPVPAVPSEKRCQDCGDADADTRSGTVICRRCADAALASLAHTD